MLMIWHQRHEYKMAYRSEHRKLGNAGGCLIEFLPKS